MHGEHATLHVFPAMPVALAVEFGRIIMPKGRLKHGDLRPKSVAWRLRAGACDTPAIGSLQIAALQKSALQIVTGERYRYLPNLEYSNSCERRREWDHSDDISSGIGQAWPVLLAKALAGHANRPVRRGQTSLFLNWMSAQFND